MKGMKKMTEDKIEKIMLIKNKLKTGEVLSRDEHDFCRMNTRIFENLKFKKMKKWQQ